MSIIFGIVSCSFFGLFQVFIFLCVLCMAVLVFRIRFRFLRCGLTATKAQSLFIIPLGRCDHPPEVRDLGAGPFRGAGRFHEEHTLL